MKSKWEFFTKDELIKIAQESISFSDFGKKLGYKKGICMSTKENIYKTYPEIEEIFIDKRKQCDLTGKQFGRLTVLEKDIIKTQETGKVHWKCKCSCGNPKILSIYQNHLKSGASTSCGCSKIEDLEGQMFGFLEPIKIDWERSGKGHSAYWLCKCHKCNNPELKSIPAASLKNGHSTTCGCISNFSKGEEKIEQILKDNNIFYQKQYIFDDCRGKNNAPLKFDFYIRFNEKIYLIEYQGIQHFKVIEGWGGEEGLNIRQERDKKKRDYCNEKNLTLIEISYKDFNKINFDYLIKLFN